MTVAKSTVRRALSRDVIQRTVDKYGFCAYATGQSYDEFLSFCGQFGEVFHIADVKLVGGPRPRAYQRADEVEFHTDHISARLAAWYCIEREPTGNEMRLIDLAPLGTKMSADELTALSRAKIYLRKPEHGAWEEGHIPVWQTRDGRDLYQYIAWSPPAFEDGAAQAAFERFQGLINNAIRSDVIEVDLQKGDALFLDNNRVMHGRHALPRNSKRYLKRILVR